MGMHIMCFCYANALVRMGYALGFAHGSWGWQCNRWQRKARNSCFSSTL